MIRCDVLVALNQEQSPEPAGIQQLLRPAVHRCIAQDESGGEHPPAPLLRVGDLFARLDGGGQRLLREDILPGGEGGEDVIPVAGVGGKDHHPVDTGGMNRLFRRSGGQGIRRLPDLAQRLLEQLPVGIESGYHPDGAAGVLQQIFDHITRPISRAEHGDTELFSHDPLSLPC